MDKLLLAAFLSSFAGFITAVISIVKLVNEKENKTSEFRQAWTNSVRNSIADLSAKLASITANIEYQSRLIVIEGKLMEKTGEANEKRLESIRETLLNIRRDISSNRHDLFQSYSLCKLHFKPDDKEFKPIEDKFDLISAGNKTIYDSKINAERTKTKAENYEYIQNMVETGRGILKKEWERVKEGERAYKNTKKYSLIGGMFMLIILLMTGLYAVFLVTKAHEYNLIDSASTAVDAKKADITQCWQMKNIKGRIFKLNSCTGEMVEFGRTEGANIK